MKPGTSGPRKFTQREFIAQFCARIGGASNAEVQDEFDLDPKSAGRHLRVLETSKRAYVGSRPGCRMRWFGTTAEAAEFVAGVDRVAPAQD